MDVDIWRYSVSSLACIETRNLTPATNSNGEIIKRTRQSLSLMTLGQGDEREDAVGGSNIVAAMKTFNKRPLITLKVTGT